MNHDELERLRDLLERGREPANKVSTLRRTMLLIKAKLGPTHVENRKKDEAA